MQTLPPPPPHAVRPRFGLMSAYDRLVKDPYEVLKAQVLQRSNYGGISRLTPPLDVLAKASDDPSLRDTFKAIYFPRKGDLAKIPTTIRREQAQHLESMLGYLPVLYRTAVEITGDKGKHAGFRGRDWDQLGRELGQLGKDPFLIPLKEVSSKAIGSRKERTLELLKRYPQLDTDFLLTSFQSYFDNLGQIANTIKAIDDLPLITANNLIRHHYFTQDPQSMIEKQLAAGWETEQTPEGELPVADLIVVGLGPAGLAAMDQASRLKAKVVGFEAEYIANAFADAGAGAVHVMRTGAGGSSIDQPWFPNPEHGLPKLTMPAIGEKLGLRTKARNAVKPIENALGHRLIGRSSDRLKHPTEPVPRGALVNYFDEIADQLALRPDTFLQEDMGGITDIEILPSGHFLVKTAAGHVQVGKRLMLATGFVGVTGEHARIPEVFRQLCRQNPGNFLLIANRSELKSRNDDLDTVIRNQLPNIQSLSRQVVLTDPLLGEPAIWPLIDNLPPGTRVPVIGSGESAAKAALQLLSRNPDIRVDLLAKGPIKVAQVQIPERTILPPSILKGLFDPDFARETLREWKEDFGVPITPATYRRLLKYQDQGKLKIYELGAYCDKNAVRLGNYTTKDFSSGKERSVTRFSFINPAQVEHIRKMLAEYRSEGLKNSEFDLKKDAGGDYFADYDGPIVLATGYEQFDASQDPIIRKLTDAGLLKLENGRIRNVGTASPVTAVGTMNIISAPDSAIFGCGVRARTMVNHLLSTLGQNLTALHARNQLIEMARVAVNNPSPPDRNHHLTLDQLRQLNPRIREVEDTSTYGRTDADLDWYVQILTPLDDSETQLTLKRYLAGNKLESWEKIALIRKLRTQDGLVDPKVLPDWVHKKISRLMEPSLMTQAGQWLRGWLQ